MDQMKQTICRVCLGALAVIATGVSIQISVYKIQPIVGGLLLIAAATTLLGLTITAKLKRMTKGLSLVAVGALTTGLYEIAIKTQILRITAETNEWISGFTGMDHLAVIQIGTGTLTTLVSFMNLACAGAGGSIIAVEGDRTSIETPLPKSQTQPPQAPAPGTATDYAPMFQTLNQRIDTQSEVIKGLESSLDDLSKHQRQLKWWVLGAGSMITLALVAILLTLVW